MNFNIKQLLSEIKETAWQFEKTTLEQMDGVKLMDRMDVKYLIPIHMISKILKEVQEHYLLLEVNEKRLCAYETLYYDTDKLDLYHSHQNGKLNRYKVRFRNYVGSNLSFFEIKQNTNKGRTLKTRIKQPNVFKEKLNHEEATFLEQTTPLKAEELIGNLKVNYDRMTLVNKTAKERLTLDFNLTFISKDKQKNYGQMVVAEVKQEKLGASPVTDIFKKNNLRAGAISKYCLGVMSHHSEVKSNRFKAKFLHLKKVIHQYDIFARATS